MGTHDLLWAGANQKREHTLFFYIRMQNALEPDRSHTAAVMQFGMVGLNWQLPFYANLDAFLAMARSVPAIIECCFGWDQRLEKWLKSLSKDEQDRRRNFQNEFDPLHYAFRQHALTKQRDRSFHREGYPDAEVRITSWFGVEHIGSPTKAVPTSEIRTLPTDADPALQVAAAGRPMPIEPHWSDFTIDGKPLFDECKSYLDEVTTLHTKAQEIAQRVHGNKPLTAPVLP